MNTKWNIQIWYEKQKIQILYDPIIWNYEESSLTEKWLENFTWCEKLYGP